MHKAGHNNLLKTNKDIVFVYINKFIQDCTDNFSYYEENSNLEKSENIDNNKDSYKSISLIKNDNIELKKDEEIQNKSYYEEEEKFKNKINTRKILSFPNSPSNKKIKSINLGDIYS